MILDHLLNFCAWQQETVRGRRKSPSVEGPAGKFLGRRFSIPQNLVCTDTGSYRDKSDALFVSPSDGIKGVPRACQASLLFSLVVLRSCPGLSKLLIAWLYVQVPQEHRLLHT